MGSLVRKKAQMLDPPRVKKFLKELERTGNLAASASRVNVTKAAIYAAMKRDEFFKEAVEMARARAAHDIENELRRRGIEGYEEEVFHNGEMVGTKRKYSDRLLELLAKGNIEKYGKLEQNLGVNINLGSDSIKDKLANMLGVQVEKNEDDVIEGEFRHLD
jgi:hypothetical protein